MTDLHFGALDNVELDLESDFYINDEIIADKIEDAPRKQSDCNDIIDYLAQGYGDDEQPCPFIDLGWAVNFDGDPAISGNPTILYIDHDKHIDT